MVLARYDIMSIGLRWWPPWVRRTAPTEATGSPISDLAERVEKKTRGLQKGFFVHDHLHLLLHLLLLRLHGRGGALLVHARLHVQVA